MKPGSGVIGFLSCITIKSFEVYSLSGLAILLCTDEHPVTPCYGSPVRAGSITPSCAMWSSPALTSSYQCTGTNTGVWWGTSVTFGSIIMQRGFLSISGWERQNRQFCMWLFLLETCKFGRVFLNIVVGEYALPRLRGDEGFVVVVPFVVHS